MKFHKNYKQMFVQWIRLWNLSAHNARDIEVYSVFQLGPFQRQPAVHSTGFVQWPHTHYKQRAGLEMFQ
jgi:hypothetical protein